MFPKHKIDHKNIVNMDTTVYVNYTKGIIKEALFVGCLDPKEIKICRIAESWAKDAPNWKELNGRNKIKNVAAIPVSINRRNEITAVEKSNGHCFWESDLGKYKPLAW